MPISILRARNSFSWKKLSFSLEIKGWPWGSIHKAVLGCKGSLRAYHFLSRPLVSSSGQGTELWRGRKADLWQPKEPSQRIGLLGLIGLEQKRLNQFTWSR